MLNCRQGADNGTHRFISVPGQSSRAWMAKAAGTKRTFQEPDTSAGSDTEKQYRTDCARLGVGLGGRALFGHPDQQHFRNLLGCPVSHQTSRYSLLSNMRGRHAVQLHRRWRHTLYRWRKDKSDRFQHSGALLATMQARGGTGAARPTSLPAIGQWRSLRNSAQRLARPRRLWPQTEKPLSGRKAHRRSTDSRRSRPSLARIQGIMVHVNRVMSCG